MAGRPLPGREAEFVEAGRRLRDREQSDTRRRTRRLRILATVTSLLAVIALVVGLVAIRAAGRADDQATIAEARRVGAEALQEPAYDRALLLAVEGVHLSDSAETRDNLLDMPVGATDLAAALSAAPTVELSGLWTVVRSR